GGRGGRSPRGGPGSLPRRSPKRRLRRRAQRPRRRPAEATPTSGRRRARGEGPTSADPAVVVVVHPVPAGVLLLEIALAGFALEGVRPAVRALRAMDGLEGSPHLIGGHDDRRGERDQCERLGDEMFHAWTVGRPASAG